MGDPFGDSLNDASAPLVGPPGYYPRTSLTGGISFPSAATQPSLIAVWSVSPAEKAKSDQIFLTIDQDQDGLVNGSECKPVFLQSGLTPPVLAHIWALCDIRRNGLLNVEQFALAFHLIQQKLRMNIDPPVTLSPDLVPPSMRMYSTHFPVPGVPGAVDSANDDEGGDESLKKEIKDLDDEIHQIKADKAQLVQEVEARKADIQTRQNEVVNMTKELEQLQAAVKQLDYQRGEAQKRLEDLDSQKSRLQTAVTALTTELNLEREKANGARSEYDRRQMSQKEQEDEIGRKRAELEKMKREELQMKQKLEQQKVKLSKLEEGVNEGDARIVQLEGHLEKIHFLNATLREAVSQFDVAISTQDLSGINPIFLQKPVSELTFSAGTINFDPIEIHSMSTTTNSTSYFPPATPTADDHFYGQDPFVKALPSHFISGAVAEDPWGASPFGGSSVDPFGGAGGFPPESPLPALPPKKISTSIPAQLTGGASKQPPPRPAPPKAGAKNPAKKEHASPAKDAFEGDPWGSGGGNETGYAFPAFEQPNTSAFATDFDDFGKF